VTFHLKTSVSVSVDGFLKSYLMHTLGRFHDTPAIEHSGSPNQTRNPSPVQFSSQTGSSIDIPDLESLHIDEIQCMLPPSPDSACFGLAEQIHDIANRFGQMSLSKVSTPRQWFLNQPHTAPFRSTNAMKFKARWHPSWRNGKITRWHIPSLQAVNYTRSGIIKTCE
jgi:hypothetical protein